MWDAPPKKILCKALETLFSSLRSCQDGKSTSRQSTHESRRLYCLLLKRRRDVRSYRAKRGSSEEKAFPDRCDISSSLSLASFAITGNIGRTTLANSKEGVLAPHRIHPCSDLYAVQEHNGTLGNRSDTKL